MKRTTCRLGWRPGLFQFAAVDRSAVTQQLRAARGAFRTLGVGFRPRSFLRFRLSLRRAGRKRKAASTQPTGYIPIKVRSEVSIKGKKDHGTYYLILPPPLIDAVVIEKTDYWTRDNSFGRPGYDASGGKISPGINDPCVLRRADVLGRHLWRQPDGRGTRYMCSVELWSRIREAKFRGWQVYKNCTLE